MVGDPFVVWLEGRREPGLRGLGRVLREQGARALGDEGTRRRLQRARALFDLEGEHGGLRGGPVGAAARLGSGR